MGTKQLVVPWFSLRKEDGYGDTRFHPPVPLSVGFDRLPSLLSDALGRDESGIHPTTSRSAADQYRIVLALPGFSKDDIEIVLHHNRLFIRGKMKDRNGSTYLHRGIAGRAFEREFDLADYIEVTGATMGDGVLVIDLKRELPEALHASLTVSMAEAKRSLRMDRADRFEVAAPARRFPTTRTVSRPPDGPSR